MPRFPPIFASRSCSLPVPIPRGAGTRSYSPASCFTDAEVLLPPGSSSSGGSSARWGWGFLLPSAGLCPSWLPRADFPLVLGS